MSQSQCQRLRPSHPRWLRLGQRAQSLRGARLLLPTALIAALAGCTTDGQVTDPLAALGNPFQRPTEAGFRAMIEHNCAQLTIGDTTVDALLGKNNQFDQWITALYEGDISNDEFMNQVLLQYPAPDANVPATGCIMDELERCFAETCQVQTAAERDKMARKNAQQVEEIETAVTIDPTELPAKDAPEIDRMIEVSKEDEPKPLP